MQKPQTKYPLARIIVDTRDGRLDYFIPLDVAQEMKLPSIVVDNTDDRCFYDPDRKSKLSRI